VVLACWLLAPSAAHAVNAPFECSETPQPNKSKCVGLMTTAWRYWITPAMASPAEYNLGPFRSEAEATAAAQSVTAANSAGQWCTFSYDHTEPDSEATYYDLGIDTGHNGRVYYKVLGFQYEHPPCMTNTYAVAWLVKSRQVQCPAQMAGESRWTIVADSSVNGESQYYCACPWYSVCQPPCCDKTLGNPIEMFSGAKVQPEVDYEAAGAFPLRFDRTYRSDVASMSSMRNDHAPLGIGWSGTYFQHLTPASSGGQRSVIAHRPSGQVRLFRRTATGYISEGGDPDQLLATATGWQYKTASEDVETYDQKGRLLSISNRAGITHTLTYASPDETNPASVVDSFGNRLTFTYLPYASATYINKLSAVTLPDGTQISYTYDTYENATQVTYPNATTRKYLYTLASIQQPNLLTGIVDENGVQFATFEYSGAQATKTEHAGGVDRYTFAYGWNGERTVVDPLGTSRTYTPETVWGARRYGASNVLCANCGDAKSTLYDAMGNVQRRTDFKDTQTVYTYEPTRPLETSRTEAYGTSRARTVTTTWHAMFRLPKQITEPNRVTGFTHDSKGNVLTKTITDTSATPNVSRTWSYTYDAYGQVLSEDGPRTDVSDITTYTYYKCTTGFQCGQVRTVTNALNQTVTFDTYNAHGQPLTMTDANGVITVFTYDARQRLSSRRVGSETTTFSYWPTGLLKKVTLPDGSFLQNTYDDAHRLVNIEDAEGNRVQYTLDKMGNRIAENTYDPSGVLARTRAHVFNSLNQLWKQVPAAGTAAVTTVFAYDGAGNLQSSSAPLGRGITTQYDERNRLRQVTDAANGVTTLDYDANDNLISVTDPRQLITSYQYTGFGERKAVISPDTGTTTSTFDSGGNLKTRKDARNVTATYKYDALNRPISITYPDATFSFSYDAGANGVGRMTGAADANHSLAFTYDEQGRIASKTQIVSGLTRTVRYTYTNGNLTSMVTPSGQTLAYTYSSGRVASVSVNGSLILSGVAYEPFGPVRQWTWSNGRGSLVRTFDRDGNITQISTAGEVLAYDHDDATRIRGISNGSSSALSWTYAYDNLDRLASATSPSRNERWTYDANGNRVTQAGTAPATFSNALSISLTSNRVSALSGSRSNVYAYDSAGSLTSETNAYRAIVSSSPVTATYRYNALGQRVMKTVGSVATHFIYDESGHLLGEYASNGALIQETVWLGDIPVATLRPKSGGGVEIFHVHTDHLNAPRKVTRAADGVLVWRWDPAPFGDTQPNENPRSAGAFRYNLRFPGQYYDGESGLAYNYFRDYDPALGRYIESDPIGLAGGRNTYAYVAGNPVSAIDWLGLVWKFVGWQIERSRGWARLWTDYVNVLALCEDDCTRERQRVTAYTWQTRPMCVNDPMCSQNTDPTRGLKSLAENTQGLGSAISYAHECGALNGYQCFLANTPQTEGQKFCRLLK
jgi:RHS repeat-associated protein